MASPFTPLEPTPPQALRFPTTAAALAFAAAAVTLFQAGHVAVTGEELCVGGGCAVVARLTRISPAAFNLVGTAVFAFLGCAALAARSARRPWAATALQVVAAAALGAEGVLFAYQWHVAGAWCLYCLAILGTVAAVNLAAGLPGLLFGCSAFGASLTVFSLLSFVPANPRLDAGTAAVERPGQSPALVLIYSENCPHCRNVLETAGSLDRCEVRYNPISASAALPEGVEASATHDPRVNLATANLLGLDTIPILVAREPDGLRILTGEGAIASYLDRHCRARPVPPDPLLAPWGNEGLLGPPRDDGCGLAPDCE
jgi:hypothetical protein